VMIIQLPAIYFFLLETFFWFKFYITDVIVSAFMSGSHCVFLDATSGRVFFVF
jgi:hypothetical protein